MDFSSLECSKVQGSSLVRTIQVDTSYDGLQNQ